jgi:phosphoadenosine phosphosulfate reductase
MTSLAQPSSRPDLEEQTAEEVLGYMAESFHPRLYVACSFQKEASVILDMFLKIEPSARFFVLDTGVLFPETYDTWRRVEEHYDITVDVFRGDTSQDGLWNTDTDACCGLRKVSPLAEALGSVDAWVSGLRRDQSPGRAATPKLAWDAKHGLWKGNPLADWSERDVWNYIAKNDVPYHPLHDRGYGSIGCTHCTAPSAGRDGRWSGSAKSECGIHVA